MTVSEMLSRMSSREFAEWMAYFMLEPFGQTRDDRRAGEIAAMLANIHRDEKKRSAPFTPIDFFPEIDPDWANKILIDEPLDSEVIDVAKEQKIGSAIAEKIGAAFPRPAGFRKPKKDKD